jgi:hypothetical protein
MMSDGNAPRRASLKHASPAQRTVAHWQAKQQFEKQFEKQ